MGTRAKIKDMAIALREAEKRMDMVIANAPHHYQCKLGYLLPGTNYTSGCTCWKAELRPNRR